MGLAEAEAVGDHLVAGLEAGMGGTLHHAGEIDAEKHRELARDRRLAGKRQPVLVIDGRVRDADRHVAVHQLGVFGLYEADRLARSGLIHPHRFERHASAPWLALGVF